MYPPRCFSLLDLLQLRANWTELNFASCAAAATQDDSYYEAMLAATQYEEDNTSQAGSRSVSRDRNYSLNDEEYYRGMMEMGTTCSSGA